MTHSTPLLAACMEPCGKGSDCAPSSAHRSHAGASHRALYRRRSSNTPARGDLSSATRPPCPVARLRRSKSFRPVNRSRPFRGANYHARAHRTWRSRRLDQDRCTEPLLEPCLTLARSPSRVREFSPKIPIFILGRPKTLPLWLSPERPIAITHSGKFAD